jgi:hypothetical protein
MILRQAISYSRWDIDNIYAYPFHTYSNSIKSVEDRSMLPLKNEVFYKWRMIFDNCGRWKHYWVREFVPVISRAKNVFKQILIFHKKFVFIFKIGDMISYSK